MLDDDSTKDINESEWRENGNDTRVADLVKKCTGIWFSGGDQSRTMRTLVHADGSQTPVLEAVWDVFRSGGVIGGTSAGAAIMSEVMIGGGTSMAALCHGVVTDYTGDDFPEGQGVWVTRGLGFFPCGVVDQHFNARARFGRLAVTLMNNRKAGNLGFGIDENTALIYNRKQNRMQVAGVGGVTMLNTTDARIFYVQKLPVMENLAVSYLGEGDSYDFTTGTVTPAEGKKPIHGSEHYKDRYAGQDGILSPAPPNFRDLITTQLADNKATDTIQNITFLSSVSGFRVTLRKTPSSEGFHAGKPVHGDPYTVTGIRMDITPVSISATPLNNK